MKLIFLFIMLSLSSLAQSDTTQVVFYGKDSHLVNENYFVMDAYGDTLSQDLSNDWVREIVGYIIFNGGRVDSVDRCFHKLEKEFKVMTVVPFSGFAPRYDVDTVLEPYGSHEFYYQTKGYLK